MTAKLIRPNADQRRPASQFPYLVAYDVRCPKRAAKVLSALKRWRLDGQYSVHETVLAYFQLQDLVVELREQIDPKEDRLLTARLSERPAPLYHLCRKQVVSSLAARQHQLPKQLKDGWYLLSYDISDMKRLQSFHYRLAKHAAFTQKSVYLYQGSGDKLLKIIEEILPILQKGQDDLRLYPLRGAADIWFLAQAKAPARDDGNTRLAGLKDAEPLPEKKPDLLRLILRFFQRSKGQDE